MKEASPMRESHGLYRLIYLFVGTMLLPLGHAAFAAPPIDEGGACESTQLVLVADASTPSGEGSNPPDDVQERAVPRMGAPGMPAPQFEGGVLEGNRLRIKPGYTLERKPDGTAMLRPSGGGNGFKMSCRCTKTGGCFMQADTHSAWCTPDGCKGDCQMRVITGLTSPGMMMK
jgi:hypothetical protein